LGKKKVIIYGAGGYGGVGLVENLLTHPHIEISALVSREGAGEPYHKLYPHLTGQMELVVEHADDFNPQGKGDLVFFSTPDGVGQRLAKNYLDAGLKIIDFSGDFRFDNNDTYRSYSAWQQGESDHFDETLLNDSVYGMVELNRDEIRNAKIVGNPGCMAVSCLLALLPVCKEELIQTNSIVCDVKTGISGAGKKPKPGYHYPAASENAYPYKVGKHQHIFEIEKNLSMVADTSISIQFTPHVIPMTRGIISTCYCKVNAGVEEADIINSFEQIYADDPFVSCHINDTSLNLSRVRGSNRCDLGIYFDSRTHSLVITSLIDNLQKGQSGNAVQVMNIMLGYDETLGLKNQTRYP
jgi:N-acetyl-gamma-glutamyl-phosphate reductase